MQQLVGAFNFGDNNPLRAKAFLKNYKIPLKKNLMLLEHPLIINEKIFLNTLIPDALGFYYLNWLNGPCGK